VPIGTPALEACLCAIPIGYALFAEGSRFGAETQTISPSSPDCALACLASLESRARLEVELSGKLEMGSVGREIAELLGVP